MEKVVSLQEFKRQKELHLASMPSESRMRPRIKDKDIWGRNYAEFDNIVFGILKTREVLDYHLHFSEEWKHYLLCLLENAYYAKSEGRPFFTSDPLTQLKRYIVEETSPLNAKDMGRALVLLDLIEKSVPEEQTIRH